MECYREVLTFDPEEATAKERLGALTAAMERQVCGVCVGGWDMGDRGCCEMGCSLSLMYPSLVPVTHLSPLLDLSLCTAVCVCVCWTAFLHVVMVMSHSSLLALFTGCSLPAIVMATPCILLHVSCYIHNTH